ncbi:hypothetical protein CJO85_22510 (plasmid) [Ralstonia solanacearum]|nr:hypothetical protein CJO85_22510 [Ralstonia solanacearum]
MSLCGFGELATLAVPMGFARPIVRGKLQVRVVLRGGADVLMPHDGEPFAPTGTRPSQFNARMSR